MRTPFAIIRGRIHEVALFDVRIQLYKEIDSLRLLRMVLSSCEMHLLPKIEEGSPDDSVISDYGKFIFIKSHWSSEQVASLFEDMENGSFLKIAGFHSIIWNSTGEELQFDENRVSSGQRHSLFCRPFPFDLYEVPGDLENSSEFNAFQSMYSSGVPFFPTLQDAEAYFLYDTYLEGINPSRRRIQVVLEDKRAWFDRIVVTKFGLNIHLCGSELSKCEIKLFGRFPGYVSVIPISGEDIEIPLDRLPAELTVFLALGREVLDQRFISETTSIYAPTVGVTIERDEQTSIEGILNIRGENQHIEFKSGYSERVLDTICAFGNADGGSIFMGMSNEGDVLGIENWDNVRLQIENGIETRLNGHVIIKYVPHSLSTAEGHEGTILEVRVEEAGSSKPISLRIPGKGERFYLRRDGTNRLMKRDDFVYLMQNR